MEFKRRASVMALVSSFRRRQSSTTPNPEWRNESKYVNTKRYDNEETDGGWGWMVVGGALFALMTEMGIVQTLGMFIEPLEQEFESGAAVMGIIASACFATLCAMCPVGSLAVKRFGCRKTAILGGVIMSSGLILSSFMTSILELFVCVDLIAGSGAAFVHMSSTVVVGQYFNKRYALANGIAYTGQGFGLFIFPNLLQELISEYGWRGTLMIEGAIAFNIVAAVCLFRPIKSQKSRSSLPLQSCEKACNLNKNEEPTQCNGHTSEQISDEKSEKLQNKQPTQCNGHISKQISDEKSEKLQNNEATQCNGHISKQISGEKSEKLQNNEATQCNGHISKQISDEKSEKLQNNEATQCNGHISKQISDEKSEKQQNNETTQCNGHISNQTSDKKSKKLSVVACTENGTTKVVLAHNEKEVEAEQDKKRQRFKFKCTCKVILETPTVLVIYFVFLMQAIGFVAVAAHIVPQAIENNVSQDTAPFILSVLGIGSLLGRVVHGIIIDKKIVSAKMGMALVHLLCVVGTILNPLIGKYGSMLACAAMVGFASGWFFPLMQVILRQMVGLQRLPSAYGLGMFFEGVGCATGGYLAGFVKDSSGSYDPAFYFISGCFAVAMTVLLLEHFYDLLRKKKQKRLQRYDII